MKKALFPEQNHSAKRKSQTFILRFPGFSTPIPATIFSLLTSNERKEEALRRRRSSTLSPLYRGLGWEGTATWRTSPSVLSQFFSKQCLLHVPCLGAGHGLKMRAVRGRMQTLPGSQDLSERGLEVEERADEAISTSSCVRGTLVLGDAVKVRASIAQRRGRRCGEAIRVFG